INLPNEIGDVTGLPRLLDALREAGYGEPLLAKLCRTNWLRVLKKTWGE
ncbi:MAG TPA: peptidase, partial [Erwinia persicina]|nr:peptidase [Erwinia persicina]